MMVLLRSRIFFATRLNDVQKTISFRGIRSLLVLAIEPSLVFMIIKVRIGMITLILTGFGYFDQWAIRLFLCPLWYDGKCFSGHELSCILNNYFANTGRAGDKMPWF